MDGDATGSRSCLTEAEACGFVDGSMPVAHRDGAAGHLAACDACRRWLAELVKVESPAAEAAPDPGDPLIGTRLGRYQLLERLGAGAAGLVYRARDPSLERDVAIKLIREPGEPLLGPRLLREARAMARVVHPAVVSVYDIGEAEGELFVAMELVEAGTLAQWLGEPRDWRQIATLFVDVGSGLAEIHRAGLIHRDVKPENILVAGDGERALVADLGLTGAAIQDLGAAPEGRSPSGAGETDAIVGTPAYLAPEVAAGAPATPRSDQLAFGRSLHRALTGEIPPADGSGLRRALARAGAPERLARLVARAVSSDPERRFSSMDDVVSELRATLGGARRRIRVAAAVAAGIAGAALLFFLWPREEAGCDRALTRADFVWGDAERRSVRERLRQLDAAEGPLVFAQVEAQLDGYVAGWKSFRREICRATERGGDALALRRAACLEDRLDELESVIATFEAVTLDKARRVDSALTVLDPRASCMGERPFVRPQPPAEIAADVEKARSEIARANADIYLGDTAAALGRLEGLRPRAESLGDAALLADLAYTEGTAAYRASDYARARDRFDDAVAKGELSGHDRVRALALSALTTLPGLPYETALDYAERARRVIARVRASGALRANIEILIADLHYRHGEYDEAKKAAQIALAELEAADDTRSPRHSSRLADVLIRLSAIDTDPARAGRYAERALELLEAAFPGADRPEVAEALVAVAETHRRQGELDEAVAALRRALELHGRIFGEDHLHRARILSNLCVASTDRLVRDHGASLSAATDGVRQAREACDGARAIADAHAARADVARLQAVYESATARLHLASGSHESAAEHFERAIERAQGTDGNPVDIASMEVGLASSLSYLGRDLDRALELATGARDTYEAAFGPEMASELDAMIERLRAATRERRPRPRGGSR